MMNCNGGGQCGLCAVRVADGAFGPRYEWEERHVAKLGADARLACQTTVKGRRRGDGDAPGAVRCFVILDARLLSPPIGHPSARGGGCR